MGTHAFVLFRVDRPTRMSDNLTDLGVLDGFLQVVLLITKEPLVICQAQTELGVRPYPWFLTKGEVPQYLFVQLDGFLDLASSDLAIISIVLPCDEQSRERHTEESPVLQAVRGCGRQALPSKSHGLRPVPCFRSTQKFLPNLIGRLHGIVTRREGKLTLPHHGE